MSSNIKTTSGDIAQALTPYIIGFALSLALTISAYLIVTQHLAVGTVAIGAIAILAIIQLAVQLIFFLHLGRGQSRWNIMALIFMLMVVTIIVFGSIWIMDNLNYHMMSPEQMDQYMKQQSNKGF